MTADSGSDGTEDEDIGSNSHHNSMGDYDDSSPVSTQSDISQKFVTPETDKEPGGYHTLPRTGHDSISSGMSFLFWTFLIVGSIIPAVVLLSHVCEDGESYQCQSFQTIVHSVASILPGMHCFGGKVSKNVDASRDEEDEEELPSSQPWMKGPIRNARTLTSEEIKYTENGPLFLVIVGHVFDVTQGKSYYAPGTGYFGFIGQDASRAFVSGEFNEKGLVDDIDGLSSQDYLGLANWIKFYFDKYTFVGYHIGKFFDKNGRETPYLKKFKQYVIQAESAEEEEKDMRKLFPPCNIAWSSEHGSRVWCTTQSGGVKRDWVGYPRQFFETQKEPRCACVHPNLLSDPRIRQYANCHPKSESCIPPDS